MPKQDPVRSDCTLSAQPPLYLTRHFAASRHLVVPKGKGLARHPYTFEWDWISTAYLDFIEFEAFVWRSFVSFSDGLLTQRKDQVRFGQGKPVTGRWLTLVPRNWTAIISETDRLGADRSIIL